MEIVPLPKPTPDPAAARARVMIERARGPLKISIAMVAAMAIGLPLAIGLPVLSVLGGVVMLTLVLALSAVDTSMAAFRAGAHLVYTAGIVSLAYAVLGLGLPAPITVYFSSFMLLGAAQLLGARAALFWSVPCIGLVAAGVAMAPEVPRDVSPWVQFAVRAGTLVTICAYAVSFRRAQDRQTQNLERRAVTDELTGLANRRELDRALEEALLRSRRYGRRGATVFVDLDGMKKLNDSLGHSAGDELLRGVANRIAQITRRVDTAARVGGDEFVIVLSEFDEPKGAEIFARRLLQLLEHPLSIEGVDVTPSASIGVALFPDAGAEPDELVRRADRAMYQAKRAGGQLIVLDDGKSQREIR